ncbi:MAG: hypothetical protein WCA35_25075 [Kovacikia sp.]
MDYVSGVPKVEVGVSAGSETFSKPGAYIFWKLRPWISKPHPHKSYGWCAVALGVNTLLIHQAVPWYRTQQAQQVWISRRGMRTPWSSATKTVITMTDCLPQHEEFGSPKAANWWELLIRFSRLLYSR